MLLTYLDESYTVEYGPRRGRRLQRRNKTIGAQDVTIILRGVDRYGLAPSHASRLVQAVDLVTFLYRRMVNGTGHDPGEAAANEKLWSWVEQRRYHSWCWSPTARQMHEGPA
ncbi:hypothetical protein KBX53_07725 [Micromonospora sp. M51]|uniref:DUF433 domain-containing protein n=1 Tax=Micromonospora parva TaxID=1464048 RepID=A0ABW6VVZ8_9ACTN|nr:hypothetical protein [Micromonospora sp. M51]